MSAPSTHSAQVIRETVLPVAQLPAGSSIQPNGMEKGRQRCEPRVQMWHS